MDPGQRNREVAMKRIAAVLFATCVSTPALAFPVAHFSWESSGGVVVNQDWTGPVTYRQTLSVS